MRLSHCGLPAAGEERKGPGGPGPCRRIGAGSALGSLASVALSSDPAVTSYQRWALAERAKNTR